MLSSIFVLLWFFLKNNLSGSGYTLSFAWINQSFCNCTNLYTAYYFESFWAEFKDRSSKCLFLQTMGVSSRHHHENQFSGEKLNLFYLN